MGWIAGQTLPSNPKPHHKTTISGGWGRLTGHLRFWWGEFGVVTGIFRKILSLKKAGESDRGNSFKRLTQFFLLPHKKKMSLCFQDDFFFFGWGVGSKMEIWQHLAPPPSKMYRTPKNPSVSRAAPFELIVGVLNVPPSQSPKKVVLPGQVTTIFDCLAVAGNPTVATFTMIAM